MESATVQRIVVPRAARSMARPWRLRERRPTSLMDQARCQLRLA